MNEDIEEFIELVSETGPFNIPLKCETKKCNIEISPKLIQFGDVPLGDSKQLLVKIANSGAVPTSFEILPYNQDQSQFTVETTKSHLEGYSS